MSEKMHPLTLNAIRERRPCKKGWEKLLLHLGKAQAEDEPLLLSTVLTSNGLIDARNRLMRKLVNEVMFG